MGRGWYTAAEQSGATPGDKPTGPETANGEGDDESGLKTGPETEINVEGAKTEMPGEVRSDSDAFMVDTGQPIGRYDDVDPMVDVDDLLYEIQFGYVEGLFV